MAIDLTIDRKASDPEEVARIAESGGFVTNGRVQGTLAVSRALGDSQLKAPGRRVLIADPGTHASTLTHKLSPLLHLSTLPTLDC